MDQEKIVEILKTIVNYFLAIFVHFGYIKEEDIAEAEEFFGSFTEAE